MLRCGKAKTVGIRRVFSHLRNGIVFSSSRPEAESDKELSSQARAAERLDGRAVIVNLACRVALSFSLWFELVFYSDLMGIMILSDGSKDTSASLRAKAGSKLA